MATRIDFSALSIQERLDLIEELWDSVDQHDVPPPSPELLAELDRRAIEAEQHPQGGKPWHEVRDALRKGLE